MSEATHRHYDSHDAGPEWGTPPRIWRPLADTLSGFDLDPASGAEREPIADTRWTVYDGGRSREWFGDVWLNPPYGREYNEKWAEKALTEWRSGRLDTLTVLVPAATDTQWFQNHYAKAHRFTFVEGRIAFDGAGDGKASFASVIATFGETPAEYTEALRSLGFVLDADGGNR